MPTAKAFSTPLLIDRPQNLITYRIARLNARLTAQAYRVLSESAGISLTQWRVFATIDADGPTTAADIARRTSFDKALISRTVNAMLEAGHLSAVDDPADHRRQLLDLTRKGRATAERARDTMRHRQETLLDSLTHKQRNTLFRCFDQLEKAIDLMETEQ